MKAALFKRTCCYTLALFLAWAILPSFSFAQTTGYSGTGANIDVVYHRINWRINPDSATKAVRGSVTTYFKTMVANVGTITFDLRRSAFNNANLNVSYHGSSLPAASFSISVSNVLSINLGTTLALGTLDSVTIYYGGSPPAISGSAEGYQRSTYNATTPSAVTQNYIYTLSESYEDRDWWPCKADMQDKVDSMDIIVNTPWTGADTFWVATNGMLVDSAISGNSRTFTFKNRYPMASYLVCVSVARYKRYYTSVNVGGTNVQVAYYLFRGKSASTYNNILTAMNKVTEGVVAFGDKFGDYPFKNEKHGFYEGLGGAGGMEHQTFSAIASNALTSIATLTHELMHQWFGDKVTFSTWNHLWLAEGFARYSESLIPELVSGTGLNSLTERQSCKSSTLSSYATTSLIIPNASATTSGGIWSGSYGAAVYEKGAMVVSMLRKLAGDTKFFLALKNYLSDPLLAYKSATTNDLKNHFEAVLNYDLDPFFNDYASLSGTGNPAYDISWGYLGNGINIELTTQRRSSAAVPYFRTPVVLRISNGLSGGAKRDTTVVIYDQNGQVSYAGRGISTPHSGKILGYHLSFTPAVVTVDPDDETLVRGQDGVTAATNRVAQSTVAPKASLNVSPLITLPVDILDFYGTAREEGNLLSLVFTSTSDNIQIILERSNDGAQFYPLGAMRKTDVTADGLRYELLDNNISTEPVYYYRVKAIDETGIVKYSRIVRISNENSDAVVRLSPNPADKQVSIQWTPFPGNRNETEVRLISMAGHIVWTKKTLATTITIGTESIPAGSYLVQIKRNDNVLNKKLIIRR